MIYMYSDVCIRLAHRTIFQCMHLAPTPQTEVRQVQSDILYSMLSLNELFIHVQLSELSVNFY